MNQIFRRLLVKMVLACSDLGADIREFGHRMGNKAKMRELRRRWRKSAVVYAAVSGAGEPLSAARDVTAAVNLYYARERVLSSITLQEWLTEWCGTKHTVVELYFYKKTAYGPYQLYQAALDLDADRELHTWSETGGDTDLAAIPAVPISVRDVPAADYAAETTPLLL